MWTQSMQKLPGELGIAEDEFRNTNEREASESMREWEADIRLGRMP
jgi:hypothetical protein